MALALYNFFNPYSNESNFKSFTIKGQYIKILQSKEKGIGYTLWDCV